MDPQVKFVRFWSKVTMNPFPRDHRTIVNNGEEKRPNGIVVYYDDWLGSKPCGVEGKPTRLQLTKTKICIKRAFINKSSTALLNQVRGLFQSRLMLVFFGWADICKICNTFGLINVRTRNRLICSDWGFRTDRPADVFSLQSNTWLLEMFVEIA